jgi:hypothetical protein
LFTYFCGGIQNREDIKMSIDNLTSCTHIVFFQESLESSSLLLSLGVPLPPSELLSSLRSSPLYAPLLSSPLSFSPSALLSSFSSLDSPPLLSSSPFVSSPLVSSPFLFVYLLRFSSLLSSPVTYLLSLLIVLCNSVVFSPLIVSPFLFFSFSRFPSLFFPLHQRLRCSSPAAVLSSALLLSQ